MARPTRMAATRTKGAAKTAATRRQRSTALYRKVSARPRCLVHEVPARAGPGAPRATGRRSPRLGARSRESGRQLPAAIASTFFITTAIVSWSCALAVNSIVSVPGPADGVWPGGA